MTQTLMRLACLAAAVLFLLDLFLPGHHETGKVVAHRMERERDWKNPSRTSEVMHHWLDVTGEQTRSCEVEPQAYHGLHDGDDVGIRVSSIMQTCVYVAKVNGSLYSNRGISLWRLLTALLSLAVGFGLVSTDRIFSRDEDGRGVFR